MGAFNIVRARWRNPQTGQVLDIRVQFKYGDTWQHEYNVGDELKWGGNDTGRQGMKRVVVDGCLEAPVNIPGVPEDFEVYIVSERIERVIPATGHYDFVKSDETFIVLEE